MSNISAVAYARYSSDKQQESSITVQLAAIRKFCNTHRIELIHEYVDEAQTGTNANRKEFQEMVSAAPKKQFQLIIVHRMDRWARNVDDARYYKKYFAISRWSRHIIGKIFYVRITQSCWFCQIKIIQQHQGARKRNQTASVIRGNFVGNLFNEPPQQQGCRQHK